MNGERGQRLAGERRRELADFLRARRESLVPQAVGLSAQGRRRTPGLRREEVAMLSEIGVGWYTKLEMAHDVKVSPATLMSIARALRLNRVETEYLFTLAAVPMPLPSRLASPAPLPQAIEFLATQLPNAGVIVYDRYMTVIRWNAIGDAMFDLTAHKDPIDRNALVRLHRQTPLTGYLGEDYETVVRDTVAFFRRAYVMHPESSFAQKVFSIVKDGPLFRNYWSERLVAEEVLPPAEAPFRRHHAVVGEFRIFPGHLQVVGRTDFTVRIIAPADAASAAKFKRLAKLGKPPDPAAPPRGSDDAEPA